MSNSILVYTTTPVARTMRALKSPVNASGVSASSGILVYKDSAGQVKQIVEDEFLTLGIVPDDIAELLTDGTPTVGAGTGGSSITTTAQNVRVYFH